MISTKPDSGTQSSFLRGSFVQFVVDKDLNMSAELARTSVRQDLSRRCDSVEVALRIFFRVTVILPRKKCRITRRGGRLFDTSTRQDPTEEVDDFLIKVSYRWSDRKKKVRTIIIFKIMMNTIVLITNLSSGLKHPQNYDKKFEWRWKLKKKNYWSDLVEDQATETNWFGTSNSPGDMGSVTSNEILQRSSKNSHFIISREFNMTRYHSIGITQFRVMKQLSHGWRAMWTRFVKR